MIRDS